jgi:ABC-type nitrate/sulfonate/bicarbonate transport system permease component
MKTAKTQDRADVAPSLVDRDSVAATSPATWRRWGGRTLRVLSAPLLLLAALLALWQWYASQPNIDPQLLPTPAAIWTALVAERALLWHHMLVTLWETVVGFGAALGVGIALATIIDFSLWLRRAIYPLLVASQTIPIVALAPLLVLWFGFGLPSKALVIALICFFPIVVALADGLRSTDPELLKLYRTFGAGQLQLFWMVKLPGALPALFSGIRIAVAYSIIGAIFGEYVGSSEGLGFFILLEQHAFATAAEMATILVTALLSIALFLLVAVIERLALPWYYVGGRQGSV